MRPGVRISELGPRTQQRSGGRTGKPFRTFFVLLCLLAVLSAVCFSKEEARNGAGEISRLLATVEGQDQHLHVRVAAAETLALAGAPAVGPLTQVILRNKDETVRNLAAYALGLIGPEAGDAVPFLVITFPQITLPRMRDSEGNPYVFKKIQLEAQETGRVRRRREPVVPETDRFLTGAYALTQITGDTVVVTREDWMKWWIARDSSAMMLLAATVEDARENTDVRMSAIEGLLVIQDPGMASTLAEALVEEDAQVREKAAWALGEMRDRRGVVSLVKALGDPEPAVRTRAAESLGKVGDPQAVGALIDLLWASEPSVEQMMPGESDVVEKAILALGEIADSNHVDLFIGLLADGHPTLRTAGAWVLGEIGQPYALEPLIGALKDEDPDVRYVAAWSLRKLKDPTAIVPLAYAVGDSDQYVQEEAHDALLELNDTTAVAPLIEVLEIGDSDARSKAAEILGEIGDPAAVEPLIRALGCGDSDVSAKAAQALGRIGSAAAVPALVKALRRSDSWTKEMAGRALVQVADSAAVDYLIAALVDDDPNFRRMLLHALWDITGKDFYDDPAAWRKWWDTDGKKAFADARQQE